MDFLKKGLSKVKETMSQVDLLAKLAEATTNDSSFQTISLLNEISSRSDNPEDCDLIVRHCSKILTLKPKMWKKIQKDLALIEHIIKTGSQNFIEQIKDERDKLKDLYEFTYEEDGKDRGETSKNKNIINNIKFFYLFFI